ncbi:bifunctional phosphoglucose/phosphomannose isomerase [Candidatus Saccharibacteria bacterium]|nr:bifunctional phosphoglucose/phosphomannose isomerase [Candidatus Saccharibacteria bacterium]
MLDDLNVIKQFDASDALGVAASQPEQTNFVADVVNGDHDDRPIQQVVLSGMGGSALAALLVKTWLKTEMKVPFEIVRTYDLPDYVNSNTLVIASSYSGNTEETINGLEQALDRGAQIAVIASGGKLIEKAQESKIAHVVLPSGVQPRMGVFYNLRALVRLMVNFGIVAETRFNEISSMSEWLKAESSNWDANIPLANNYAKQLAMHAVGKTAVFYGGTLTAPVSYKWKISWNENAKNVAFWNELPEFNHNEFIGWTSHPVDKPFAVFDIISDLEHPQIKKRFEVSEKLLSGLRPKTKTINLSGKTLIEQMLWGSLLADYVSIYLAILNGINPTPVQLIEKLKQELS